jgi:hypothetical protein
MVISNTCGAKERPPCGRTDTGKFDTETITGDMFNNSGFSTGKPVRGLMLLPADGVGVEVAFTGLTVAVTTVRDFAWASIVPASNKPKVEKRIAAIIIKVNHLNLFIRCFLGNTQ